MPTQICLKERPAGLPSESTWLMTHAEQRAPNAGEIAVNVEYISVDPAMRGWISPGHNYMDPVAVGEVMAAAGVGRVHESASDAFAVGDYVTGNTGVQTHCTRSADAFQKITPGDWPLTTFVGGFGLAGMAAYFGLLRVAALESGETVVISGAAGAVGSIVGQIAKIRGCRVIGIAGGAAKCDLLINTFGFDAAIDYHSVSVPYALKTHCPDAIDVFFDNVGGETLEAALNQLAFGGRVVLCGAISQYNSSSHGDGPRNYMQLLMRRARMEGFVATDYAESFPEAVLDLAVWHRAGRLVFKEHIVEGLASFPSALNMLFSGENLGKLIIRV